MGASQGKPHEISAAADGDCQDVLCLAGAETTAVVHEVASGAQLSVRSVATTEEALNLLRAQRESSAAGGCRAVVAALGVDARNFLFNQGYGDSSDLISLAKQLGCIVLVYSYTAVRDKGTSRACMDAGADAVVASAAELQQQLAKFTMSDAIEAADLVSQGVVTGSALPPAPSAKRCNQPASLRLFPALPAGATDNRAELSYYPPLLRRAQRNQELISVMSEQHKTLIRAQTESVSRMLAGLPRPLLASLNEAGESGQEYARVVAISDTHSYHEDMHLPPGDVLIHASVIVGNYGKGYDIVGDFRSFVGWLQGVAPSYKDVVFIAGNHDTLLDPECRHAEHEEMCRIIASALPSNVTYIENSSCDVMTGRLRIWGSPVTECRQESMGKRYYSNAFERPRAERVRLYGEIPDDGSVDIVITHGPPAALSPWGDEVLQHRIDSMSHPPPFHIFGHDHDHFGVFLEAAGHTVAFNAAQEGLRRADRRGGGQAWIFDAPLR